MPSFCPFRHPKKQRITKKALVHRKKYHKPPHTHTHTPQARASFARLRPCVTFNGSQRQVTRGQKKHCCCSPFSHAIAPPHQLLAPLFHSHRGGRQTAPNCHQKNGSPCRPGSTAQNKHVFTYVGCTPRMPITSCVVFSRRFTTPLIHGTPPPSAGNGKTLCAT